MVGVAVGYKIDGTDIRLIVPKVKDKAMRKTMGDPRYVAYFGLAEQMFQVKKAALADAAWKINDERVNHEFPTAKDEYVFILTNRGRSRRQSNDDQILRWNPNYLRFNWRMRWASDVGSDFVKWKEATVEAYRTLIQRAPVRRGTYATSVHIWVGNTPVSLSNFQRMELTPQDLVRVGANPTNPKDGFGYANAVELGYYRQDAFSYETNPELSADRGVVRPIAKIIRGKYPMVSCRFAYVNLNVGGGDAQTGTFPVLEIGLEDQIVGRDAVPGVTERRRATIRNRRVRG